MKYLKYIIFTFLLMLPLNADATIRMSCGGPAKINQKITCDIKTDAPIISFKSNLVVDPAVIFGGATGSTNFESLCSHTYLEFSSLNSADKGLIGYYEITVPDTTKTSFALTLTNVEYANESDTKTQPNITEIVQISTTTKKTTTTTQKTTTQSGSDKTFSVILNSNNGTNKTETKTCKTTGSNCKINLSEISAPVKTNFVFNGWGNSQTCTEGSKTSYTATENVTLYACWQANSTETPDEGEKLYLQTLTIEGQQIEFSKFKQEYDIVVLYQVENLVINATPVKEGAKVDLNESYPLEIGENKILINLSDNDNSTTYTINVKRLKEGEEIRTPSNDATLKNIMIEGYDVNFTSGTFDYILKVSSGTTSLDVTAELNDEYGEYVITGNNDIKEGSVIKITVKAEDGTLNTYNITIEIAKGIKDYLIYIIIGSILLISIIVLVIVNQSKNQKKQDTKKTIKTKAPSKKTQTKGKSAVAPIVKSIPQAVTPQPVVPQPVTPQPVTPQPVVPKPPEPKDSVEVLDL